MPGVEVLHQHEGHAGVVRKIRKELGEGFQTSRGGTNPHDREGTVQGMHIVNFARGIREIGWRFGLKRFLSAHRRPFRDEGECFPSVPRWPEPLRGGPSAWKLDRIALRDLERHVSVFRITNIFQCQNFFGISLDWASDSPTGPIRPFSWQSDLRFLSPFSASSYSACRTAAMRAWSNTLGVSTTSACSSTSPMDQPGCSSSIRSSIFDPCFSTEINHSPDRHRYDFGGAAREKEPGGELLSA